MQKINPSGTNRVRLSCVRGFYRSEILFFICSITCFVLNQCVYIFKHYYDVFKESPQEDLDPYKSKQAGYITRGKRISANEAVCPMYQAIGPRLLSRSSRMNGKHSSLSGKDSLPTPLIWRGATSSLLTTKAISAKSTS